MYQVQQKLIVTFILFGVLFFPFEVRAQNHIEEKTTILVEEEEGPLIYQFEPNFLDAEEQRKANIQIARAIIDTMTISDRKRKRLLKDLYKNGVSERLSKVMTVETKFEDVDEIEN